MKTIDIVYVLGNGSKHNNSELKYSLRGVEMFLKNVGRVFVVGSCPQSVRNLIHLPCKDTHDVPDMNIRDKIMTACKSDFVADDFLFMNDDHFLLKPFDVTKFPNFHKGDIMKAIEPRSMDPYRKRLQNTYNQLKAKGLNTLNFDIHTPILYNKRKFLDMVKQFDWKVDQGLVIKSLYGNFYDLKTVEAKDYKIAGESQIELDTAVFSTHATISQQLQRYLQNRYPKPSQYEY